jgi:FkbH-like protein
MDHGKEIKCIVWDLDNTIWDGVLLESEQVQLKPGIKEVLKTLDERGILHSIASKNNEADALAKLKEFGIDEYFLYPEINWNAKSGSVSAIQVNLNFGMNTIAFIDDQPFEREEVGSEHPEVLLLDASEYETLVNYERFNPRFITEDSKKRRHMYHSDIVRNTVEAEYKGPKEEFLASLNMEFIISPAREEDLKRAEELTVRTNQLNATGRTYDYDELDAFRQSPDHLLLVCELTDKYGSYGKIGLALIELKPEAWHVRLLLMSCRVMARGVGTVLLTHIMQEAKKDNKKLLADFKQTDRNRMMFVAFRFANFKQLSTEEEYMLLENDLSVIQEQPPYIKLTIQH